MVHNVLTALPKLAESKKSNFRGFRGELASFPKITTKNMNSIFTLDGKHVGRP